MHTIFDFCAVLSNPTTRLYESTIHASGVIESGKDRLLLISGFSPTTMGTWMGYQPDPGFVAQCPRDVRQLLTGQQLYMGKPRSRRLGEEVGAQAQDPGTGSEAADGEGGGGGYGPS